MFVNVDKKLRNELEDIISGKGKISPGNLIQTTAGYLRAGKGASTASEQTKSAKVKETKELEDYFGPTIFRGSTALLKSSSEISPDSNAAWRRVLCSW